MTQYAASKRLIYKQAFYWWAPYTRKKCDVIISSIKARIDKTNRKYDIRIPRLISEAIIIDSFGEIQLIWK